MLYQFSRFLVAGGLAAGVNIGSRYALNFAIPFEWAVPIAYLCGMLTAFVLMRDHVFTASGRKTPSALSRFAVVNISSLFVVWAVSVVLARVLFPALAFTWQADDIAHLFGVCSTAGTSYLAHRYWTFTKAAA